MGVPKFIEWADELKTAVALIQILDDSLDWYILFHVKDDEIGVIYRNRKVRDKIKNLECVFKEGGFQHCHEFFDLKDQILEAYRGQKEISIPNYILNCGCQEESRYFNIQIYRNNGHVVLCARDMTDILTENAKSLRVATSKLDGLIDKVKQNANKSVGN